MRRLLPIVLKDDASQVALPPIFHFMKEWSSEDEGHSGLNIINDICEHMTDEVNLKCRLSAYADDPLKIDTYLNTEKLEMQSMESFVTYAACDDFQMPTEVTHKRKNCLKKACNGCLYWL